MIGLGLMVLVMVLVLLVVHVDGRPGDAESVIDEVAWGRSHAHATPRTRDASGFEPRPDAFRERSLLAGDDEECDAFEGFGIDDGDAFGFDEALSDRTFRARRLHEDDGQMSAELLPLDTDLFESTCSALDPFQDHDPSWHDDLNDDGHCINPATGLPMVGDGIGGVDVGGNPYGFSNSDTLDDHSPMGSDTISSSDSHWT